MSSSRRGDASRRESRVESRNPTPQETLPGGRGNAPAAPTFSGDVTEWKAYELKARIWSKTAARHLHQEELGLRLISSLSGAALAPFEFEDLDCYMAADGVERVMQRLRQVFGKSSITELGSALTTLMERTSRTSGQSMQAYAEAFNQAINRVREHKVNLPEEALSWLFIRRSSLSASHKA
eukprot:3609500-Amphidinium_carterae.1